MKFILLLSLCFSMFCGTAVASDPNGGALRLAQEAEDRVKKRIQDIKSGRTRLSNPEDLSRDDLETPLIVGGDEVGDEEWPWVAAILSPPAGTPIEEVDTFFDQFCGGTLITKRIVLSAAHCFNGSGRDPDLYVSLGREDLRDDSDGEIIRVATVLTQPIFASVDRGFDAAILILEEESSFEPIELLSEKEPIIGETATALGWGALDETGELGFPDVLNRVDVPIVGRAACNSPDAYAGEITSTMVCAGFLGEGGKDSCQGDSGGPLAVLRDGEYKLVGITSFGIGCAQADFPGVYALAPKFSKWLNFVKRFENQIVNATNANFNATGSSEESTDQMIFLKDANGAFRSKLLAFNDRNGLLFDVTHQPLDRFTFSFSNIDQFFANDFNADQRQDIYVFDASSNTYGLYINNGDGTFGLKLDSFD